MTSLKNDRLIRALFPPKVDRTPDLDYAPGGALLPSIALFGKK